MELRVVVAAGGREHEVAVTLTAGHTVGDLSAALANHVGALPQQLHLDTAAGSRPLDDDATVTTAGIHSGAVLRWAPRQLPEPAWEVVVVGGPDAGRILAVPPGGGVLGRSREADLVVSDAFVSRRHLRITPGADGCAIEDLGSANGTLVGGQPIGAGTVAGDDPLELGSSLVRVRRHRRPRAVAATDATSTLLAAEDMAAAVRSASGATTEPVSPDRLIEAATSRSVPLWIGRAGGAVPVRVGWGLGGAGGPGLVAPLEIDVAAGPTLVQAGADVATAHAVARLVALQAAVLYPQGEVTLAVAVTPDVADDWDWVHWLPHADAGGLLVGAAEAAAGLRSLDTDGARPLVVIDGALANADDLHDLAVAAGAIVVATAAPADGGETTARGGRSPSSWPQRVVIDPASGAVDLVARDGQRAGRGADGMAADVARRLARLLAPLRERQVDPDTPQTERPALADVVWAADADGIAATWAAARPRIGVVGLAVDGPAGFDVDRTPIAAVTGDVPAAVVEDVLAAVAGTLVTGVGPDRLALVVHDAQGRLDVIGRLPHVLEITADAASLADRLATEVERRKSLLAGSGAADWRSWRNRGDVVPAPMVVLSTDLAADGARALRDVLAGVDDLARIGMTVVAPGVEGLPASATVRLHGAGRCRLDRVDGTSVDVAVPVRTTEPSDDASIVVDRLSWGRPSRTQGHTSLQRRAAVRDHLDGLVEACVAAAATAGLARATWSPSSDAFDHGRVHRTFVFTDIVGSTALVEVIGDAAWTDLVTWHDRALRGAFATHHGEEVDHAGDGFLVAFEDAADAVACAVEIQRTLAEHRVSSGFAPRVRIGGHTTDVVRHEGYKGHGLHVAARIGALADGDQIVFSAATVDRVQPRPPTVNSRMVEVKGASAAIEVLEVDWR